ncbi:hypothetical protein LFM09_34615 [Lentzea alba]|uniref:hypothetical protein n=1 Tax=Lentzea alba TaxID=2714351 RepID=UPI0039BF4789
MIFSAPLGPGHVARQQVCRAGEVLQWAMYRQTFYYAVDGLDRLGAPGRSLVSRGVSAVGRGVGDFALTALGGGGDSADDKAPVADHLVFGSSRDCLAARVVSAFEPGKRVDRLWALTSDRLVVCARHAAAPAPSSFLGKAIGFGKDVGKILTDNRRKYGEHLEGEPVAVPDFRVVAEVPRAQIADVQSALGSLRVVLVDGSGFEFSLEDSSISVDEVVTKELTKFWLRRGERLVLGLPPIVGYVGGVVGGSLQVPWTPTSLRPPLEPHKPQTPSSLMPPLELDKPQTPSSPTPPQQDRPRTPPNHMPPLQLDKPRTPSSPMPPLEPDKPRTPPNPMPPLELGKPRWPLPAVPSPPDWIDDPTLGYWVTAPSATSLAVQLADHFAFSRGNGRLAVSDQRVAVVYPTHLFEAKPSSVFTSFAEIPSSAFRLETSFAGVSLPARRVVSLRFADGSSLDLRPQ